MRLHAPSPMGEGHHVAVLIALPWDLEELGAIACVAAKRISIRAA
ncbi:MAG: hypothetical protein ABR524_04885 [Thermoanaerobaculia bacterium]